MGELVCGICHDSPLLEVGEINSCWHRFCFTCITKWAEIESKCPFCKVRFSLIAHKRLASPGKLQSAPLHGPLPGEVVSVENIPERDQRVVFEDPNFVDWINNLGCIVCGGAENEEQLLLCDGCDQACHTYCVGLSSVPEGDWYCSACSAARTRRHPSPRRQNRQAQQPASRRRRRSISPPALRRVLERRTTISLLTDSENEEEVLGRRGGASMAQRPEAVLSRTLTNSTRGDSIRMVREQRRRNTDLDDFIVSDNQDSELDEEQEHGRRRPQPRSRTAAVTGASRNRRSRAVSLVISSNSEDEEEEWQSGNTADEHQGVIDDEDSEDTFVDSGIPRFLERGSRAARRGTADLRQQHTRGLVDEEDPFGGTASPGIRPRKRRIPELDDEGAHTPAYQTAAHRRIAAINRNWNALRSGAVSFDQIRGEGVAHKHSAAGTKTREQDDEDEDEQEELLPPRQRSRHRRLVSARELEKASRVGDGHGSRGTNKRNRSRGPVIDLTASTPRPARPAEQWQQHQHHQSGARQDLTPPLLSLSSRIRAELAHCREKGSQRVPQQRSPGSRRGHGPRSTEAAARNLNPKNPKPPPPPPPPPSLDIGSIVRRHAQPLSEQTLALAVDGVGGTHGVGGTPAVAGRQDGDVYGSGSGRGGNRRLRTAGDFAAAARMVHSTPRDTPGGEYHRSGGGAGRSRGPALLPNTQPADVFQSFAFAHMNSDNKYHLSNNASEDNSPKPLRERLRERLGMVRTADRNPPAAALMSPPPPPSTGTAIGGSQTPIDLRRPSQAQYLADSPPLSGRTPGRMGITPPPSVHGSVPFPNPKFLAKDLVKGQLNLMFSPGDLTHAQLKEVTQRAAQAVYRQYGPEANVDHAAAAVDDALKEILRK